MDFEKVFDSIHQELLWKILQHYSIPDKLVSQIIALYKNTECCIQTHKENARYISIISGVKQGCVLSPLLFVLVIVYVLQDCTGLGIQICYNKRLADLDFADNITLSKANNERLQELLDVIQEKKESFETED